MIPVFNGRPRRLRLIAEAALGFVALAGLALASSCTTRPKVLPLERTDVFVRTPTGAFQVQPGLHAAVVGYRDWHWPWELRPVARRMRLGPTDKLHPLLLRWLVDSLATHQELMVTFVDTIPMPSLAGLDSAQIRARIGSLIQRRALSFQKDTLGYAGLLGSHALESFWITQTLLMRVPMNRLSAMALRPEVMYVRPPVADEGPPIEGPNAVDQDDIAVAAEQIRALNYWMFNLVPIVQRVPSIWRPWIGLLDTGIRMTHEVFAADATIRCGDCVLGGVSCHENLDGTERHDDCAEGHGTSTAAILIGRPVAGERHMGLALNFLDSYKVYVPGSGNCGLAVNAAAAERGFQAFIEQADPVAGAKGRLILAEMAVNEPSWGVCARAADHAYDLGKQVLAAVGNAGQVGTARSPANARKVIGVGAYNISSQRSLILESLGPTVPDGRIKPDIQAPTNAEAAGNGGDRNYHIYTATSGALPFAGAATALMAGVWTSFGRDLEAGQLNAFSILCGQKTFPFDNTPETMEPSDDHPHGAGHVRLPDPMVFASGSLFMTQTLMGSDTREIEIERGSGAVDRIEVALWWADSLADESAAVVHMHSRVEAAIIAPDGSISVSSSDPRSVFQRCTATGITDGPWKLRLTAHEMREQNLPEGGTVNGQKIYWAYCVQGQ